MDKQLTGARIDRLLGQVEEHDPNAVAHLAEALGVSSEAVRNWRKGQHWPRLDKMASLVRFFTERKITASAPYILFGQSPTKMTSMEMAERFVEEGKELELLRLLRTADGTGQELMMQNARAIQMAHPRPAKVTVLKSVKKRDR